MAPEPLQLLQVVEDWHAFAGGGRELLARCQSGCWLQLDYVFPQDHCRLALHWREGHEPRLWCAAHCSGSQQAVEPAALRFPQQELDRLPRVCQGLPPALADRLLQLGQQLQQQGRLFARRRQEVRPERRARLRLPGAQKK